MACNNVDEDVFPVAIYTDEPAKDDWRKHQTTGAVEFKAEPIPDYTVNQCLEYLKEYKLAFGCFDLIETPEGELVFLECNPNGQYYWLEQKLDLPISKSIANCLFKIASEKR